MREQGTSSSKLRNIVLGLLIENLDELKRFNRELDIQRVDREGGRIFMTDGRVFSLELKSQGSIRQRQGPGRRY